MSRPFVLSHAERGLKHRNFTCAICRQRWEEGEAHGPVLQDGLFICKDNCFEPNGDVIERNNERARAAALGAILNAKEMRPPVYPTPLDGRSSSLSWISSFSVRPLIVSQLIAPTEPNLVLGGGFREGDSITCDGGVTVDADITATTATLTVTAGSTPGLFSMYLNDEPYRDCVEVH